MKKIRKIQRNYARHFMPATRDDGSVSAERTQALTQTPDRQNVKAFMYAAPPESVSIRAKRNASSFWKM